MRFSHSFIVQGLFSESYVKVNIFSFSTNIQIMLGFSICRLISQGFIPQYPPPEVKDKICDYIHL